MCVVPDFCTVDVSPLLLSLSHTGQSINLQATVVPSDRFRMYNGAQVTQIWVSPSHQFTSVTRIMCNNLCYLTATNQSLRSKTIRHSITFATKSSWQGAKCTPLHQCEPASHKTCTHCAPLPVYSTHYITGPKTDHTKVQLGGSSNVKTICKSSLVYNYP